MEKELEVSMSYPVILSSNHKRILDAVDIYVAKQESMSYVNGYNRAIEDVLDYLFNCGHSIERWAELNGNIVKMKKNESIN